MAFWLAIGIPLLTIVLLIAWTLRHLRQVHAAEKRIDWSNVRKWKDDDEDD